MSVYNQPTSNVQSNVPGGPSASENPGPGSSLASPLVQGLQLVVNTFVPDHCDEATESLSDSSSYYSPSSSSSCSLYSEVDALSVDLYLQSDDANADDIHNSAVQPTDGVDFMDDRSDATTEIVDDEEQMEEMDTVTIHPHPHAFDINEPSTLVNSNVASSDSIGPHSTVYVRLTESETFYADSLPDENPRRRLNFSEDHLNNVLNAQRAQVARAEEWARTCARQQRIEKRQNEERLAREREDMQRRREAAEREEDRRLEMLVEEAELEMEQKERDKYLLEGEREMRRQQELREEAVRKDRRMQREYLNSRKVSGEAVKSFYRRALEDNRDYLDGLISVEEYTARREADDRHLGTPEMPGNYHYTRDPTFTSRSSRNRFHPYSSAVESACSNRRHFNTIDEEEIFSFTAGRRAFKAYQEKWGCLTTPGNNVALTFRSVPWPLMTSPYTPIEIVEFRVWRFLCLGAFDGHTPRAEERRYVLEEELRRWYPDSVETWIIPCIVDKAECAAVREGAAAVQEALVLLMASG